MRLLDHHTFRAMGTTCGVGVTTTLHGSRPHTAISAAVAEVSACERALSRFGADSDLSRLNAAHGAWITSTHGSSARLVAAVHAREETGGRFDPTVLPALVAAGYDRSFEELAPRPAGTLRVARGRRRRGRSHPDPSPFRAGAAVDLGGIGKGFSADRAVRAMLDAWPSMPGGPRRPRRRYRRPRRAAGGARGGSRSPIRGTAATRSALRCAPAASRRPDATGAGSAAAAAAPPDRPGDRRAGRARAARRDRRRPRRRVRGGARHRARAHPRRRGVALRRGTPDIAALVVPTPARRSSPEISDRCARWARDVAA